MSHRPLRLAVLAALPALVALAALPAAAGGRNVSIDAPGESGGCEGFRVAFDSTPAARGALTLAVPGATPLRIDDRASAGLRVSGWDRPDFEVTACTAARDVTALARLSVSAPGGSVSVDGADGEDAVVFFLVRTPKGAVLDLAVANGPVTLRDVHGTVRARLANGPVSLQSVHGAVDVEATNGPLSFRGGSGDWSLRVTNGPLTASLPGERWDGRRLDVTTVNGPLTLRVDPRFDSPLRVGFAHGAPFSCRAAACASGRIGGLEGEAGGRSFVVGSGEPVVRISTVNGPVTILDERRRID